MLIDQNLLRSTHYRQSASRIAGRKDAVSAGALERLWVLNEHRSSTQDESKNDLQPPHVGRHQNADGASVGRRRGIRAYSFLVARSFSTTSFRSSERSVSSGLRTAWP